MICYRDMCFCAFDDCDNFGDCERALTEGVEEGAKACHLPINRFVDKPDCFKEDEDEKN